MKRMGSDLLPQGYGILPLIDDWFASGLIESGQDTLSGKFGQDVCYIGIEGYKTTLNALHGGDGGHQLRARGYGHYTVQFQRLVGVKRADTKCAGIVKGI